MNPTDRSAKPHHGDLSQNSPSDNSVPPGLARAIADRILDRLLDELDGHTDTEDPNALLDVEDVARYLQVSKRTVETLIAEGQIEPIWVRGQRRFTREALDAYVRHRAEQGEKTNG